MQELSCARCGRKLHIHEYIQNSKSLKVLSKKVILHFCSKCSPIIRNGEERNENDSL